MMEVNIAAMGIPLLGAILLGGLLLAFAAGSRIRAKRKSREAMPSLARSLGLSYRPSALPGRMGELNGVVDGHRVLIRPDKPALYVEYRFKLPGVLLSTHRERPPSGGKSVETASLRTGHASLDKRLHTRQVPVGMRERLSNPAAAGKFHEALWNLCRLPRMRGARIALEPGQLVVALKTPRWLPGGAYLLPREAATLLPAMVRVVRELEEALIGKERAG